MTICVFWLPGLADTLVPTRSSTFNLQQLHRLQYVAIVHCVFADTFSNRGRYCKLYNTTTVVIGVFSVEISVLVCCCWLRY